jgi:hypothetical protein
MSAMSRVQHWGLNRDNFTISANGVTHPGYLEDKMFLWPSFLTSEREKFSEGN